jgi:hypothetical protein
VQLPKLVQLATPDITGSFWTAWTLKIEAVSSSTSPLTNRHDVIFQKTFTQLGDWVRFGASVQKRASAEIVLLYDNGVTNRTTEQPATTDM